MGEPATIRQVAIVDDHAATLMGVSAALERNPSIVVATALLFLKLLDRQHHGTILIDHEDEHIVELLPDHTPERVGHWLRASGH